MTLRSISRIGLLAVLGTALVAAGAAAQPRYPLEMVQYEAPGGAFWISHPKEWRREIPGGPTHLMVGEPPAEAFILCTVESAQSKERMRVPQARLDRDLAEGFRSRDWPQKLAGKREVLDYQVRAVGGVPMGAIEWQSTETRAGRPAMARGIRLVRTTPAALWVAECSAIAYQRQAAEAHFQLSLRLIGDILGSVKFAP
jgi:hypothetical protein